MKSFRLPQHNAENRGRHTAQTHQYYLHYK